ncbi:MAG: double zinc ribbon domain-containing protein [Halofilum sp. (in: g-proteobacteria)]|nr:double zinc ribbon domain-containing protein [Halofilum sp. (in: g-proteobacteria)]
MSLLERLFPPRCLLCDAPGGAGLALCAGCRADLPGNGPACARCAARLPGTAPGLPELSVCGACLWRPPPFAAIHVPFAYAAPVDWLLRRFQVPRRPRRRPPARRPAGAGAAPGARAGGRGRAGAAARAPPARARLQPGGGARARPGPRAGRRPVVTGRLVRVQPDDTGRWSCPPSGAAATCATPSRSRPPRRGRTCCWSTTS